MADQHEHRFTFYPNGKHTVDGGKYVCDCGATPIDAAPYHPPYAYLWGVLTAMATPNPLGPLDHPELRRAMRDALDAAEQHGTFDAQVLADLRGTLGGVTSPGR